MIRNMNKKRFIVAILGITLSIVFISTMCIQAGENDINQGYSNVEDAIELDPVWDSVEPVMEEVTAEEAAAEEPTAEDSMVDEDTAPTEDDLIFNAFWDPNLREAGDFLYTIKDDGTAKILKYEGEDSIVYFPSELEGIPVTSVSLVLNDLSDLYIDSVIIPDGVIEIDDLAFGYSGISDIKIPDSVTTIGVGAFSGCYYLYSLSIPDGVTTIGDYAFEDCVNLRDLHIPDSVTKIGLNPFVGMESALRENPSLISDNHPTLKIIDDALFDKANNRLISYFGTEKEYEIPEGTEIIDYAFYANADIEIITLPYGMENIGPDSFFYCDNLTDIIIPETVTSIGDKAFIGCSRLRRITIPEGVTSIADGAFDYWGSRLTWTVSRDSYAEKYCIDHNLDYEYNPADNFQYLINDDRSAQITRYLGTDETLIVPEELNRRKTVAIGERSFSDCSSLTEVMIPDSVTQIADDAFAGCNSELTLFVFKGSYAEQFCQERGIPYKYNPAKELEFEEKKDGTLMITGYSGTDSELSLPFAANGKMVTKIDENAFSSCDFLNSVTIPGTITDIGKYAFYNCPNLKNVTIQDGVINIGSLAFYNCTGLTEITIPDSVLSIGDSAFSKCNNLQSIVLPSNLQSISNGLLSECKSLTSVTIPDTVTSIGDYPFSECDFLSDITIPSGVTSIGRLAFNGCDRLAALQIPEGVTSIGDDAFAGCIALTSLNLPFSLQTLGTGIFKDCIKLTSISVPTTHPFLRSIDGVLFDTVNKSLLWCPYIKEGIYEIPQGTESIAKEAFYHCDGLKGITVPESVKTIGPGAFYFCTGLESFAIPEGVTTIEDETFYNCSSLRSIIIPSSVESIKYYAFAGCSSLTVVTVPENVRSIDRHAFNGCNVSFLVAQNSYAERYCHDYNIYFEYIGMSSMEEPEIASAASAETQEQVTSPEQPTETAPVESVTLTPELEQKMILFLRAVTQSDKLGLRPYSAESQYPSYAGGYNADNKVDQKAILRNLTDGGRLNHIGEILPSFLQGGFGTSYENNSLGAYNVIARDNEQLRWLAFEMFNIEPEIYEEFKNENTYAGGPVPDMAQYRVIYKDGAFYTGAFGMDEYGTRIVIDQIQQEGNYYKVTYSYNSEYYPSILEYALHGRAILELKEESGESYFALRLLELEISGPDTIAWVQQQLTNAGYDCGIADGVAGPSTMAAVNAYQRDHGMTETEYIFTGLVSELKSENIPVQTTAEPQTQADVPSQTSADPAYVYINALGNGNIAFYDITGDGQEEMLYVPSGVPQDQIAIHVYTIVPGADSSGYVLQELLTFPAQSSHDTDYNVYYSDDGSLLIRWGAMGMAFYHEYQYQNGALVEIASGQGQIMGNPFAGATDWGYSINGETVDISRMNQWFLQRPGVALLDGVGGPFSTPYSMDYESATQHVMQGINVTPQAGGELDSVWDPEPQQSEGTTDSPSWGPAEPMTASPAPVEEETTIEDIW